MVILSKNNCITGVLQTLATSARNTWTSTYRRSFPFAPPYLLRIISSLVCSRLYLRLYQFRTWLLLTKKAFQWLMMDRTVLCSTFAFVPVTQDRHVPLMSLWVG